MKRSIIFYWILLTCSLGIGQQDSIDSQLNMLGLDDIRLITPTEEKLKIFTGLRTESFLEDLPLTVHVISHEEIEEKGYQTLTEALRSLPGIRVSASGSALDGENFLIRGHYGNTYAKILINDIPVRPSVVGAMPLASQLPIKQAERIEVIYGPSATLYGADAAAGIINIILKENDYPSFANANIEAGNENLARINVSFGGKYKIGNRALDIGLMGGFTTFNERRIKYDVDKLYNIDNYATLIGLNENTQIAYEDSDNFDNNRTLPLNKLPHQSNYIGIRASLGGFNILSQRFFRSDHSTLGLNPLAVSYADPQQTFGEEIISTAANYEKEYNKWKWRLTLNSTIYNINQNSSFKYILPTFSLISTGYGTGLIGTNSLDPTTNAAATIDSVFIAGPRFTSGNFNDFSLEYKAFIQPTDKLNLTAGIGLEGGVGEGIEQFLTLPKETATIFDIPSIIENPAASFASYTAFTELFYQSGPLSILAGFQLFRRADKLEQNRAVFNPRLGLLYKVNKQINIRAFYSEAFRYPSAFYNNSSYTISSNPNNIQINSGSLGLQPETTNNIELGLRWTINQSINVDATIFQTRTANFINYEITQLNNSEAVFWGYANSEESFSQLRGIQCKLSFNKIIPSLDMGTDISLSYTRGKERLLELLFNGNADRSLIDLPVVRAQPNFIGYMSNRIKLFEDLTIILQHSVLTSSWTRNKFRITRELTQETSDNIINEGYYTLDARAVFKFNRQLDCYLNIFNVTNKQYAGIDGTVDLDGLIYNPQSTRYISFGVNFSFN